MSGTLAHRVAGALLGHAAGDALGATTEFLALDDVRRRWPDGHRDITGGGTFGWRPGQGTDDTDLTWAVIDAYLHGYTLAGAADRMLAWYQAGPRDVGGTTAAALSAYRATRNPTTSGAAVADRAMAAGNGSLMRALATGIVRPDPSQRADEARQLSAVTHADPRCVDACVAYCDLVAHLLDGVEPLDAVTEIIEHGHVGVDVRQTLADAADATLPAERLDTSGYVLATLKVAVWAVCQPGTLEDILIQIVNLGGDADTTGAVAGGLLGARHGSEAIPTRWVDRLEYRERIFTAMTPLVDLRARHDNRVDRS